MTNKEKYNEVFRVEPDTTLCPTTVCRDCPLYNPDGLCNNTSEWWNSEYNNVSRANTNGEKYKEVFGFYPECSNWYNKEYKGGQESPSKKPKRKFIKLMARYEPDELVTYPEYRGKPYYSILYEEDGQEFVGYSSYNIDIVSKYLANYFFNQEENP